MSWHNEPALAHQLRALEGAAKIRASEAALLALKGKLNAHVVEIISTAIPVASRADFPFPSDANGALLEAQWRQTTEAWGKFFDRDPSRQPNHLLAYARALTAAGEIGNAARQMERALAPGAPYAFFPRAAKLVETICGQFPAPLRKTKIAILSTSTTSLLTPVFEALTLRDRIEADVYQGLYGAWEQEILDPGSALHRFAPQIVFIIHHWRDLEPDAGQAIAKRKALWKQLSDAHGCHIVQFGFDYPAEEPYGYLGGTLPGGRTKLIEQTNQQLREQAPSYVSILDQTAVSRQTGASWQDQQSWAMFKQHPSTGALPALAEHMMAHARAVLGLTKKVIVLDLDNTLWKGVIGEDGIDGIEIGPGTPAGESHQALQQYLLDLKKRGILLAVNSKNNLDDAKLPFEKHPHMALRLDDFAAFTANWQDKATNLREMAEKLSLGLDSFVFLDDNPLEREWVRTQLPQVMVIEPGPNVFHYMAALDRGMPFFALSLSTEDLSRADQYRSEQVRETLKATSQSMEEFLAQLQLAAAAAPVTAANLARVTQLINKTNQFNVTTKRYNEVQVAQMAAQPGAWVGAFNLEDRMGSYGLIGVVACVPGPESGLWQVDTWLMSCRVLGRQMERFMFDRLIEAAIAGGIERIRGTYKKTAKNGLVNDLFDQFGFTRLSEAEEGVEYELAVPAQPVQTAPFVRNLSAPAEPR